MLDLKGLSESEAQQAIDAYVSELRSADRRCLQSMCRGSSSADRESYRRYLQLKWAGGRRNPVSREQIDEITSNNH